MPTPDHDFGRVHRMTYFEKREDGFTSSGVLGNFEVFHDKETTVSQRTPNYKKLKRSLLPVNPYHHYKNKLFDPSSSFSASSQSVSGGLVSVWTYDMNAQAFGCRTAVNASEAADDPSQRAINKIMSQISLGKGNLAVTMAEMDKTAMHVAHTATRIFKALTALKHARFGDFTKALGVTSTRTENRNFYRGFRKASSRDGVSRQSFAWDKKFKFKDTRNESHVSDFLADTWLEYSYGWKPMLKDVYDNAEAVASLFVEHQNIVRTAKGRAQSEGKWETETIPVNNHIVYNTRATDKIWVEIEVRYRIPVSQLNPIHAFGLTNPMEVAWELVPFSFVVDWFLPIGDAIRSLTAFDGLEYAGGYKSSKHERIFESSVKGIDKTYGGVRWFNHSGGGSLTRIEYDQIRTDLTGFPSYGWPRFKDPRSLAHGASAIALLQSLFLRK
ncbi:maturation protein [ssRNA phage Gerhypos.3_17]|jgi:hypothetical protein|uniref:Maturation protein n=2 Tax=Fiersviridae TaxID=2842319 RepID=A0A8S5KY82_9VIRU|nr:maturation protein [ssRNA phage Gerhypos.3_17]QDH90190.1 MAG: hypothetical protein H3Bulk42195_000002 [Leviviridae sp.]DAD50139.1 TPA_asm: maturation protein [ssRNA phage Gerhypos.3_17]